MRQMKNFILSLISVFILGVGLVMVVYIWLDGGNFQAAQAAPLGTTWYVDTAGDDSNDCLSVGTACATIDAAVTKATDDDTIQIAAGTYVEHDIDIFKRLTLTGAGAGNTIVDGNSAGRVFQTSLEVIIFGVTIQNGAITAPSGIIFDTGGGGILNNGSLTLRDSVVVNNSTIGSGGGQRLHGRYRHPHFQPRRNDEVHHRPHNRRLERRIGRNLSG